MLRAGLFRSVRLTPTLRPTPGFVPSLARPASTFLRNPSTFPKTPSSIQLRKPSTAFALVALQLKRGIASSVAGRPASEDLPHALQNAREEARGIGQELANIIAAANFRKSAHEYDGFVRNSPSFLSPPRPFISGLGRLTCGISLERYHRGLRSGSTKTDLDHGPCRLVRFLHHYSPVLGVLNLTCYPQVPCPISERLPRPCTRHESQVYWLRDMPRVLISTLP